MEPDVFHSANAPSAREPVYNDFAVRNAVNTVDIVIEILRYEIDKLRGLLPRVDIGQGIDRVRQVFSRDTWDAIINYFLRFVTKAATKVHCVDGNIVLGNSGSLGTRNGDTLASLVRSPSAEPGFSHQWHNNYGLLPPRIYRSSEDDEGVSVDDESDRLSLPSTAAESNVDAGKIQALEKQLAELQKQMTFLLQSKADERKSPEVIPSPPRNAATVTSNVIPRVSPPPGPPPPPPPPPSFLKSKPKSDGLPKGCVSQSNGDKASDALRPPKPAPRAPQLSDVLKELSNVQLKKVVAARSPGGTPMRSRSSHTSTSSMDASENDMSHLDPGSFIAAALRKKFQNTRVSGNYNVDTDGEDTWDEESVKERVG